MKNKNSCSRLFPEKEIVGLFFFVLDDRMEKVSKYIEVRHGFINKGRGEIPPLRSE